MKLLAISGSLRKESVNTLLVAQLETLLPEGATMERASIDLPLYNSDLESAYPEAATTFKKQIEAADAIVIATPEYNRSIPGVLKNAIDWASRPYGKNSFAGKPVLVVGVSVGKIGTAVAQSHLKEVLLYLDARVVGQPEIYLGPSQEVFNEAGAFKDESTRALLAHALQTLVSRSTEA